MAESKSLTSNFAGQHGLAIFFTLHKDFVVFVRRLSIHVWSSCLIVPFVGQQVIQKASNAWPESLTHFDIKFFFFNRHNLTVENRFTHVSRRKTQPRRPKECVKVFEVQCIDRPFTFQSKFPLLHLRSTSCVPN